jgi:hypothetical protein
MPAIPAVPSDGDLVTAQHHLLWLYTENMRPSLQQELQFRSTICMCSQQLDGSVLNSVWKWGSSSTSHLLCFQHSVA